ncbi:NAD(P)H-dependent oxidoreductase [Tsukamurella ocularis]|uniref:NADPH-dependent FMN reductase n=1 Tax=Tsukamurella ocularis TaxID=1970234 RepID=UPI0039EFB860
MKESHRPRISVVIGSTRPVRIGDQLAAEMAQEISSVSESDVRILDLREIGLPLLDEPVMAALHQYAHDHTQAWSREILESDAIVFVTPQYNAGYPASLKNAIDYLYDEWNGRPAAIVSYGGRGGGMSARQLAEVLRFVKTDLIDEQPQLTIAREDYTAAGVLGNPEAVVERYSAEIRSMARALDARARAFAAQR